MTRNEFADKVIEYAAELGMKSQPMDRIRNNAVVRRNLDAR